MSTTIVLHGGKTSIESSQTDQFFSLFTSLPQTKRVKAILVYWARDRNTWDKVFGRDREKILRTKNKEIDFILPESPKDLFKSIGDCDIVYVAGGEAYNIEPLYEQLSNLKSAVEGKIYLGSSMGAFLASESYVLSADAQDTNSVHKGLGLVKVNCLAHWNVEPKKEQKLKLLQQSSRLPILTLGEGEYSTFVI